MNIKISFRISIWIKKYLLLKSLKNYFYIFTFKKHDPYHKAITNEQNSLTKGLTPGETKKINWPIPNGEIYPSEK